MESTKWPTESLDWAAHAYALLAPRINVKGRIALVVLVAVVCAFGWLLWRAYSVIQTPNEVLVDKLGLDIPPPPVITLEEIGVREVQVSWKSPDAGASVQEYQVEVNGRHVGVTKKNETAAAIFNLKPASFHDIRIFSISAGRFQTPSTSLHVRTAAASQDESEHTRHETPPAIRTLVSRLPSTPAIAPAPTMTREPSGGLVHRRGTTNRRPSPAGQQVDPSAGQLDEPPGGTDEATDDILAELSQRFQKIQQDIDITETQIQDEDRDYNQWLKEMEVKKEELRLGLKERDEASSDLRKQVHKAEAANRTAISEKQKKERLLEQKQNARSKRKDEMARWEEQTSTMTEEMEGIKTQQAAIERRKQSEIHEVRLQIEEEQREVAILDEDNKEKGLQIKALEEERKQLDAEEETEESREAERSERERDWRWRERMNQLTATYSRVLYDLQQAHQQYNLARDRWTMYENQRRTMVSFAPTVPLDMDTVRRGMKPVRRNRQAGSYGSSVSSPRTAFGTDSYNMNAHFSTTVNASPTTFGPSFFNFQNGMTLMVPSDNTENVVDEPEMLTAAPMSPRADLLLPADLLGDESTDELSIHGDDISPRPASVKSRSLKGSHEGSGSRSGHSSSPRSFASPHEELARIADSDRRSSASPLSQDWNIEMGEGNETIKKSAVSNLFNFNRQRGKSLANQPPLLGSLKAGQSQSFPRNMDDFDPSAQPRRRLSYSGNWAFPVGSLLARGHSVRETERIAAGRRNFAGLSFGKSTTATRNYDPFAPEQSLRGEASPSRPASIYSFDKMSRPSGESHFHAWSLDKGVRNSPLAPDWGSSISRSQSRRPSIYGSTSNLSLGQPGDEEFIPARKEPSWPLQAPIGTRPASSQRPATPRLNPAAPSFTMFFKNKEKVKDRVKGKDVEKKDRDGKVSEADSASPPESRKSRDAHSIAATTSTRESRDSLERTPSGYSGGGTPSESTPSRPTFISKMARKASSNKFGFSKSQGGGIFSRKEGKEGSTPTGEHDDDNPDFFARSYESMTSTPIEDKDKKASRTSLGSWNFMRKSKKGNKDDLAASEVSESSERAFSEIDDDHDDEH